MVLKSLITGVAVSLAGFFGCSKSAAPATATKATSAAVQSSTKDLGILEMTNNYETCVSFGPGKDCRMVPKMLDRKNILITLTLESKKPDGKPSGLSVVELEGTVQKQFEVTIGNTDFTFTPQIVTE
ncbi:MAG TPA: hypothetical protein VMF08_02825 [Candidatus Sulfotelmatobacter sp.]|nr:hypothetical protein [Candidatus Sulfotelmatobacter sp.]